MKHCPRWASRAMLALICLAALTAARGLAWAEGEWDGVRDMGELAYGALATVSLDAGPVGYDFTPPSGSVYDVCAFPIEGSGEVSARLFRGGELLCEGSGALTLLSERLSAGALYRVELSGAGRVRLEIARRALSRCFDEPMALDAAGDVYAKAIARAGDVHWYALTPGDGQPLVLAGVPAEAGLSLDAQLFDDSGVLLALAARTTGGACLMDFRPEAGRTYRVRVTSPDGGTGLYGLHVARSAGGLPEAVTLSDESVTLNGRERRALGARVSPAGAADVLFWESSDPSVVVVDESGVLTGRRPGTAVVTAYAAGAVRARCRVEVARVAAEGIALLARRIDMHVGDDMALEWRVLPDNASDPRVRFEIEPGGVAEVDERGVLRAVGEGEAILTARTADGGYAASVGVFVSPAQRRYRALLVGEQSYAATVASVRLGSANSVAGLRSMLGELSYGGARFEIHTRLDVSRDGVLAAVDACLGGASAQDVSLFYITCHGYYADGMTCFQMYDGSVLTAAELRRALNRVPGEVIALIDCCGSGGVIGRASVPGDILRGVDEVFGGTVGAPLMASSKFRVLASAALEQDSYRISFSGDGSESGMATAFARAVCEGGGWSIDRAARSAMRADVNFDNVVTLAELYDYAARRVMWYLQLSGGGYVQTVQVSPEGDVNALFERTE